MREDPPQTIVRSNHAEAQGAVTLRINRPGVKNALGPTELQHLLDCQMDPDVRVVILTGTGRILNRPAYSQCRILVGGENFGCGSSREHAVWGLIQFGIEAVVAPSFGEIFYLNALNNRLLVAVVSSQDRERFWLDISNPETHRISISVEGLCVRSKNHQTAYRLPRRCQMFAERLDLIDATLKYRAVIAEFEQKHWSDHPWLKSVAARSMNRSQPLS